MENAERTSAIARGAFTPPNYLRHKMSILRQTFCFSLVAALFLITAHHLPAPIQESPESPTPTPEQPRKTQELLSASQPLPSNTNAPNPSPTSSATSSSRSFVTETTSSSSSISAWPGEALPESRIRRLKAEDVAAWNGEKLRYAINEMYARGGY